MRGADESTGLSNIALVNSLGAILGGLLGIGLYQIEPKLIWVGAAGSYLLAAIILSQYQEKPSLGEESDIGDYVRNLVSVLRRPDTWLVVLGTGAMVAPFLLWQIHFGAFGVRFIILGFFLMKLAASVAPVLIRKRDLSVDRLPQIAVANIVAVILFGLSDNPTMLAVSFLGHVVLQVMLIILLNVQFHELVDSDFRASAGSITSLAVTATSVVLAIAAGRLAESFGFLAGVSVSAGLYTVVAMSTTKARNGEAYN